MEDERPSDWLTYRELGERLGVTAEVIRYRALRGKWPRRRGNDGRARVQMPEDAPPVRTLGAQGARTPGARPVRTPGAPRADEALTHALESHIKTLQADNEALTQDLATTRADLSAHVASLKTENERLAGQLAGAETRAGEEAAKTAQAIAAFSSLAVKLEGIAEARRPWWRRLVG